MILITDPWVDSKILTYEDEDSARGPGWYEAECEECGRTTSGYESTVEDWAYEHVYEAHPQEKNYNGTTPTPAEEPMTTKDSPNTPLHHSLSGEITQSEIELSEGRALYQYWRDILEGDNRSYLGPHAKNVDWTDIGAKPQEGWIELAKRINAWVSGTSTNPVPVLAKKSLEVVHRLDSLIPRDDFLVTSWVNGRQLDEEGKPRQVGTAKNSVTNTGDQWGAVVNDHYLATTVGEPVEDKIGAWGSTKAAKAAEGALVMPKDDVVKRFLSSYEADVAVAEHAKKVVELNTTKSPSSSPVDGLADVDTTQVRRGFSLRRLFGRGA